MPRFSPHEEELREALRGGERGTQRLWYGLTEGGGAAWEARANPRWDRFLTSSVGSEDWRAQAPRHEETLAATRERIIDFDRFSTVFEEFGGEWEPVPGTARWDEVIPWQATYWKSLPSGVRRCQDVRTARPSACRLPAAAWRQQASALEAFRAWNDLD